MKLLCASCGAADGDNNKLKNCDDCDLVKYCSVKCQNDHRPQHKQACEKRAAELRDEILFKQPESSHYGDCPICYLPIPVEQEKSGMHSCCSKRVCKGCYHANTMREIEGRLQHKCPFCRKAVPKSKEEGDGYLVKRIEANDPVAMRQVGTKRFHEGDYRAAFEYSEKAASLGDVEAHYQLAISYRDGIGVELNEKRALYHSEKAAIAGHADARHNLGCMEMMNFQVNRALKHFIIAAKLGYDKSMKCLMDLYQAGLVSNEDFTAALRGHKAAIDATKSPQRDEAAAFAAFAMREERKMRGGKKSKNKKKRKKGKKKA